jgi:hypothetical protein
MESISQKPGENYSGSTFTIGKHEVVKLVQNHGKNNCTFTIRQHMDVTYERFSFARQQKKAVPMLNHFLNYGTV